MTRTSARLATSYTGKRDGLDWLRAATPESWNEMIQQSPPVRGVLQLRIGGLVGLQIPGGQRIVLRELSSVPADEGERAGDSLVRCVQRSVARFIGGQEMDIMEWQGKPREDPIPDDLRVGKEDDNAMKRWHGGTASRIQKAILAAAIRLSREMRRCAMPSRQLEHGKATPVSTAPSRCRSVIGRDRRANRCRAAVESDVARVQRRDGTPSRETRR